jgi:hypothetical protein
MQVSINIAVFWFIFSTMALDAAAAEPGKISGRVNFCDRGGVLGMKISLSGRQVSIYTADDGNFVFDTVAEGRYALIYTVNEKLVHISDNIVVKPGEITRFGEIAVCVQEQTETMDSELQSLTDIQCPPESQAPECIDNDKDGVAAAKDCDDNNEHVRPGAPEACDGIDNNCNGKIDDLGTVWIENGEGICQNGAIAVKSCNRGYADCDSDPSNGCEIDIMNDNDNCGACGNVCPSLEICVAGIC